MAVARRTFDEAVGEITSKELNEEMYEDSLPILELIKENLHRWAADVPLGSDVHPYFIRRLSL